MQELKIPVCISAFLIDLLKTVYDTVKAPVKRSRGADAHREVTHRNHLGNCEEAYVKIADAVAKCICRIHAPTVFALFSLGSPPDLALIIRIISRFFAHHISAVIETDVLAQLEVTQLVKYIAENTVAL